MRKVYTLDDHFATGEATVQPVLLWGRNGRLLRESFSAKTASEASDYIKHVEPRPGTSVVLVLALGAYETYDLNRNGDGFNEHPYKQGVKPSCGCCSYPDGAWISAAETLPQHFRTFERHGKIRKHHRNTDSDPSYGDVLKAFWNPYMHRVELLLGLDNAKAPDLVQRISDGEYPAVSMGARIQWDVCLVCGHKAPTRKDYCEHLKFAMRQVGPSGLRNGALNPSPKFFDISFVTKPADQTGYMLKKVAEASYALKSSAELGEALERYEEKRAAYKKLADITKVLKGQAVDFKTSPLSAAEAANLKNYHSMLFPPDSPWEAFDDASLKALAKHPTASVLATLAQSGIFLTTPEMVKMMVARLAPDLSDYVTEALLQKCIDVQTHIFELFAQHPQLVDQLGASGVLPTDETVPSPDVKGIAAKYLEKRAYIGDYLYRKIIPVSLRAPEPNWTDTVSLTDPATGEQHATTRGAVRDARDEVARKELLRIAATGAFAGAGSTVMAGAAPKWARPFIHGAMAYTTLPNLKMRKGPTYIADDGSEVPHITELAKMGSDWTPEIVGGLGGVMAIQMLGQDYINRLHSGEAARDDSLLGKLRHTAGAVAYENPFALKAGLAGLMLGIHGARAKPWHMPYAKTASQIRVAESVDGVTPGEVDIDSVIEDIAARLD